MLFDPYSLILFATAIVALYCLQLRRSRVKLPLPPGPRKLPLVGNLLDFPATFAWEKYMEWSRTYSSDILHLNAAGTSLIILSSTKAATDLLDKKSAIYSDRPRMPMINELMGWDDDFGFMKYGNRWRMHRRLFHSVFNNEAVQLFRPTELTATHGLLRRILHDPDAVMDHLRHMAGEIIMSVTYGIDVLPKNDPYVALAEHALHSLTDAGSPGRFLVNFIPILKHVPEWLPGAGFQRQAKAWKELKRRMVEKPFAEAKRSMSMGNAPYSFTVSALRTLDDAENKEHQETAVKSIAAAVYSGGADTTVSALSSFILAMLCNPDVQKKAQAEIDSVVREGHLPDFDDEPSLPYVSAVVKEVLRWRPVVPMGIPHFLSVEDEYQGYRIPAGSIVIANAWAILHDEVMYPDPYTFKPERFLLDGKPNPAIRYPDAAFGYGRRICPGRHMATSSVFITVASILAAFNITKTVGDDGKLIEPSQEYTSSLLTSPLPFKCSIKPRSRAALELIRATEKI
ncbi:cytochrome P450 [Mycena rosella]|uniref:Cytochrome P450 n=1 Tax=Mycena rosella TaxID=1033263 RepID=A0AAD7DBU9_MYCRO|nr:cytochrome P450 [Mycena rosella]